VDTLYVSQDAAASFAGLYRTYARDVYRFALYLSGDAALAEDITSETFLRVWQAEGSLRLSTVKSFLLVIARNLYLHEQRRISRSRPLDDSHAAGESFARNLEAQQELDRTVEALKLLPEVDRAALLLRVVEELPYSEIAEVLHLSVAAAKVKVHRARLHLAEHLQRSRTHASH
jgi:RNA polymerase sigma-70 factor (ECF subfamily)